MTGPAPAGSIRLDKWLWQARFFKSRTAATRLCADGRVRIGGRPVDKAHALVRPGDVLTFPQARAIRVVRVVALGTRRGPASEAQQLYDDLSPEAPPGGTARRAGPPVGGPRPTKADRRAIDRLLGRNEG